jgi:PAS domain S-box-containing protein
MTEEKPDTAKMAQRDIASVIEEGERFRRLVEDANVVGWELDLKTWLFTYVSPKVADMFGYPVEAWYQPNFWASHIHPDDRDFAVNYCVAATGRGEDHDFEYRFLTAEGRAIWLRDIVTVHKDENGSRWLRGFMVDVTEKRNMITALKESEERYRTLLDMAPVGVLVQRNGTFLFANPTAARLLGATRPEDVINKPVLDIVHPDSRKLVTERIERINGAGDKVPFIEEKLIGLDGKVIDVEAAGGPITYDCEACVLTVLHDITGRKKAEIESQEKSQRLKDMNRELEEFAFIASHDLREPMRMISAYVALIERRLEGKFDEETRQFMDMAVEGAKRLDRSILDLLDYSRIGQFDTPPILVPIREAIDAAITNLTLAAKESLAHIYISPELPSLAVERVEMVSLFQNLIGNALKYRHPSRTPDIAVMAQPIDKAWEFAVIDNGIGIASEYHERIFRIFQRLSPKGSQEGTGIGLAMCRKIVERHGGRIWVESKEGEGSVFLFTFPAT